MRFKISLFCLGLFVIVSLSKANAKEDVVIPDGKEIKGSPTSSSYHDSSRSPYASMGHAHDEGDSRYEKEHDRGHGEYRDKDRDEYREKDREYRDRDRDEHDDNRDRNRGRHNDDDDDDRDSYLSKSGHRRGHDKDDDKGLFSFFGGKDGLFNGGGKDGLFNFGGNSGIVNSMFRVMSAMFESVVNMFSNFNLGYCLIPLPL